MTAKNQQRLSQRTCDDWCLKRRVGSGDLLVLNRRNFFVALASGIVKSSHVQTQVPSFTKYREYSLEDLFGNKYQVGNSERDEWFDEFWAAYPRRVGKHDALKAWKKITPDRETYERIIGAIHWQIYTWEKPYTFTPYPATWLRGRRWLDEMPDDIKRWLKALAWGRNEHHAEIARDILSRNRISFEDARPVRVALTPNQIAIRAQIEAEYGR